MIGRKEKKQKTLKSFSKPFGLLLLVSIILGGVTAFFYLQVNRSQIDAFYLPGEFEFLQGICTVGTLLEVGALVFFGGLLLIEIIVLISKKDVLLKKAAYTGISVFCSSLFFTFIALGIFLKFCVFPTFSVYWVVTGFFTCLTTCNVILMAGFFYVLVLQQKRMESFSLKIRKN